MGKKCKNTEMRQFVGIKISEPEREQKKVRLQRQARVVTLLPLMISKTAYTSSRESLNFSLEKGGTGK